MRELPQVAALRLATAIGKEKRRDYKAFEERRFDPITHNKAIQKAVESYRVSEERKDYLRQLRIK